MTNDEIQDLLRQKPDYREIEFAGESRGFLLGKRAFDIAAQEGIDISEVLSDASDGGQRDLMENLDRTAKLLFTGMAPFDEGLDLDAVEALITASDAKMIGDVMNDVFSAFAEDVEAESDSTTAGKGQS